MRASGWLLLAGVTSVVAGALIAQRLVGGRLAAPQPPFTPMADVRLLMEAVIDPAADVGWDAVATVVSSAGVEEIAPKSEEEWTAIRNSAVVLMESGNLLMMEPRAKDSEDWMKFARALVDAGAVVLKAAEAKDKDALLASGAVTYDACENCHQKYSYPFEQ